MVFVIFDTCDSFFYEIIKIQSKKATTGNNQKKTHSLFTFIKSAAAHAQNIQILYETYSTAAC